MAGFKVGYFVGSLATRSINRLLAKALVTIAPPKLHMMEISFGELPLYRYDYDVPYLAVATAFKDAIGSMDAVLFVTPEYNRSIAGALKNAIDWASRRYGTNAFTRKASGIIGTSAGLIGTAIAQQHLRSVLAFCNSPLMNSIEADIQFEDGLISEDGQVSNASTREFLQNYMAECHNFISRVSHRVAAQRAGVSTRDRGRAA
jgi:chromate reductase